MTGIPSWIALKCSDGSILILPLPHIIALIQSPTHPIYTVIEEDARLHFNTYSPLLPFPSRLPWSPRVFQPSPSTSFSSQPASSPKSSSTASGWPLNRMKLTNTGVKDRWRTVELPDGYTTASSFAFSAEPLLDERMRYVFGSCSQRPQDAAHTAGRVSSHSKQSSASTSLLQSAPSHSPRPQQPSSHNLNRHKRVQVHVEC